MAAEALVPYPRPVSSQSWLPYCWRPTSSFSLAYAESLILRRVENCDVVAEFVPLPCGAEIRTVRCVASQEPQYLGRAPLVLLHGMGAGVGLWCKNLGHLAQQRPVYAVDLLGFGRSSRVAFPTESVACERRFVDSVEQWRLAVGIDAMLLLGHSFGAYVAFCYAAGHAANVRKLILADPWGLLPPPPDFRLPPVVSRIAAVVQRWDLDPLDVLRAAGPLGPTLVRRFRGDIRRFFCDAGASGGSDDSADILDYVYHCNAQVPSGETGFKRLTQQMAFAARPGLPRAHELPPELPVAVICGGVSRLYRLHRQRGEPSVGEQLRAARSSAPPEATETFDMPLCGHHVYAEDSETFNRIVLSVCAGC